MIVPVTSTPLRVAVTVTWVALVTVPPVIVTIALALVPLPGMAAEVLASAVVGILSPDLPGGRAQTVPTAGDRIKAGGEQSRGSA